MRQTGAFAGITDLSKKQPEDSQHYTGATHTIREVPKTSFAFEGGVVFGLMISIVFMLVAKRIFK